MKPLIIIFAIISIIVLIFAGSQVMLLIKAIDYDIETDRLIEAGMVEGE